MLIVPQAILAGLNPRFASAVLRLKSIADARGLQGHVPATGGFRSAAEQARLYAIGRSATQVARRVKMQGRNGAVTDAPPWSSAHNWGLGIDVEGRDQGAIVRLGRELGFGTVSWDPAHLEWPNWMAALRQAGIAV